MERASIDIEALIPHRDRMKLIETVVAIDDERATTAATTSEDWPLYRDGSVDILITIELVAQTAALLQGWKQVRSGGGGTRGWLVGIKNAAFNVPRLSVPVTLRTEVAQSCALEGYAAFSGTVRLGDRTVATLNIQAFHQEMDS